MKLSLSEDVNSESLKKDFTFGNGRRRPHHGPYEADVRGGEAPALGRSSEASPGGRLASGIVSRSPGRIFSVIVVELAELQ